MNLARVKKLESLAYHPATPEKEKESAIAMLKKHGVALRTTKQKSPIRRKKRVASVADSDVEHLIKSYDKNDPEWGWDEGFKKENFKFIVSDAKGKNSWAFSNKEEAIFYAKTLVK